MLTRVAQDAERALRAVEQAEGLLDDEAIAEARQLLRDLIGQDFDVDDDGVPRLHRGTRQGRIISTVDPEMRHGRKSESQRFDGFKLRVAVTNSAEPLITAVDVGDASAHDGSHAKELVDQQPQALRPERVLGDSAYGDQQTREDMQQRGVAVLARVPEGEVREDRIGKREPRDHRSAYFEAVAQTFPQNDDKKGARPSSRVARSGAFAGTLWPTRPERFELPTFGSVDRRSIQLSYGRLCMFFLQIQHFL